MFKSFKCFLTALVTHDFHPCPIAAVTATEENYLPQLAFKDIFSNYRSRVPVHFCSCLGAEWIAAVPTGLEQVIFETTAQALGLCPIQYIVFMYHSLQVTERKIASHGD